MYKKSIDNICERNIYNKDEDNIYRKISYSMGGCFDDYDLYINSFHKNLEIRCQFMDYDIEDNPINRAIIINRKAAIYLIIDLLKFILTGRI